MRTATPTPPLTGPYAVAVTDVQEHSGTTWVDDLDLDDALRIAAYWRTVPGFRASTHIVAPIRQATS